MPKVLGLRRGTGREAAQRGVEREEKIHRVAVALIEEEAEGRGDLAVLRQLGAVGEQRQDLRRRRETLSGIRFIHEVSAKRR